MAAKWIELVTGSAPFDAPNTYAVLQKVCEHDPPPLRAEQPDVPALDIDQTPSKPPPPPSR